MPKFDELKKEINGLSKKLSNDDEFTDAELHIEDAYKSASDADLDTLSEIVDTFRNVKMPANLTLNVVKAKIQSLDESLKLGSIAKIIAGINQRNRALTNLTQELEKQNKSAGEDAKFFDRIKDAIVKGNKTADEVKTIVDSINSSSKSDKEKLKSLIDGVVNVIGIFKP